MKKILVLISLLGLVACDRAPKLDNDDKKTLYALGVEIGKSVGNFELSKAEVSIVVSGLKDQLNKDKIKVNSNEFMGKIRDLSMNRVKAKAQVEVGESEKFLVSKTTEAGAKKQDSGLIFIETKAGAGTVPKPTDTVKVHYEGKLRDGTVFDSSLKRGEPATFPLNGVIPCWTEALQLMKTGGKSKIFCPAKIAYGDRGAPPQIPGGAALEFEIELIGIEVAKKK
ncbi:MAG: FKBP-type peptidyl-prolyl cis-trans isomerase [Pseudomonadota bacterium]|nr:FKBP-type peptidyl-prolyl cis-trans isomerase [Pseudomonadota bacterium]